jgi:hypothetical protein
MKGDKRNEYSERGMKGEYLAKRTPESPAPEKRSAKQPQGSGNFNVERTPFGKKVK